MFPPTKRCPKRVGGAPFSKPYRAPGQPLSARTHPAKKPSSDTKVPLSARDDSSYAVGRGDGSTTPCTGRAEEYYSQLLGGPGEAGTGPKARQDWALVQEIDALDHFNKEERKRAQTKEKAVRHQAQLQQQLQARQHVTERCRDVWKQWRTELEEDVVQFEKEEESKRIYVKDAQKRFNQERMQQLEDERKKRALRKEEDNKFDLEMLELSAEQKRRQDEADEKKKMKQKADMKFMKTEMEMAVDRRRQAKKDEQARDLKMQEQYAELLDEEERKRQGYFANIHAKQQQFLAKYEKGVGDEMARLAARDDERARKQQSEREQKEKTDQEGRERWRRDLAESGRVAVQSQLQLQAEERQKHRQDEQSYLEKLRKEAEIADAKEKDKVRRKKEACFANAEYVQKQIVQKEAEATARRVAQVQMTETEKQFNKEKLERACDPTRADGLQSLLGKKRTEYRQMNFNRPKNVGLPC